MPSKMKTKVIPIVSIVLTASVACGIAILSERIYHRPRETMNNLLRFWMLLSGAREERFNISGVSMHYYYAGRRGAPVVLIHGLGSSAETWFALMPLLSKEFLVYAPDLPGFGRTPLAPEGTNIKTHVHYLKRFIEELGYPRVSLVGNSLGGWIATSFAIENPERVESLYLLNSAGLRRENMHSPYVEDRKAAKSSLEHMLGFSLPVPAFVLDAFVRNSQTPAYKRFVREYDSREELDTVLVEVQTPTTIIWGERDNVLPMACAHDFHTGIANSELILLPHIGHMPQIQNPFKIARIIMRNLP
jgi:pimeloyl-ACP methyl ester carboxylesterase